VNRALSKADDILESWRKMITIIFRMVSAGITDQSVEMEKVINKITHQLITINNLIACQMMMCQTVISQGKIALTSLLFGAYFKEHYARKNSHASIVLNALKISQD